MNKQVKKIDRLKEKPQSLVEWIMKYESDIENGQELEFNTSQFTSKEIEFAMVALLSKWKIEYLHMKLIVSKRPVKKESVLEKTTNPINVKTENLNNENDENKQ